MKTILYKAEERGHANHGWLDAHHTFSFANYYDQEKVHFGVLRVLNDDSIEGGMGFGMHPHDNMEIITIMLEGSLEHKDSMGNHGVIGPGEIQVMSAGTGIYHSEFNHNKDKKAKLFQIWMFPKMQNVTPRYDQMKLEVSERKNIWQQIVQPGPAEKGLWIHQNAWLSIGQFDSGTETEYKIKRERNGAYIMVIDGSIEVNQQTLNRRDGIGISNIESVKIKVNADSEILLMDVPMTVN
ncbi:MAG TPA: hypothetical protein DCQ93_04115 [Bacteroidetes bacterium]|nr:hypothetical protein [Bacteroidota bacterium]